MEPWFHSWYRGRVETLDAKYNLAYINSTLCGHTDSSKRATITYLCPYEGGSDIEGTVVCLGHPLLVQFNQLLDTVQESIFIKLLNGRIVITCGGVRVGDGDQWGGGWVMVVISLTGRLADSADLLNLIMFSIGRNSLILSSAPRYAFSPSKHCN